MHLSYVGSILTTATATNVAYTFKKAIDRILESADRSVASLDLLTQLDLERVKGWNTHFPEAIDACVHDLLLNHAAASPGSPAICCWDGDLTYEELDKLSAPLACYLISRGVRNETLVPVCFNKSMYAIVCMVAVLRAGGAFVPMDPAHPPSRLQTIAQNTNARLILASPETSILFSGLVSQTITVSGPFLASLSEPLNVLPVNVRTYNAAFVLFTSGSTGEPKGIVQEHASVCTSSLAHGRTLNMTPKSRVFQYAAYTFDVSMMDIFTTLIYGGCVCIPSEEDRRSNIVGSINTMQVNWVLFTPSVAGLLSPEEVPTLETLVLGGEAITQECILRWAHKLRLFNCYGPCECAAATILEISPGSGKISGIGRTFGCGISWVVDTRDHNILVPIGAIGELAVEGPTLARGYLNDMEKTKSSFVKSPKWPSQIAGSRTRRLYKTGDLVRYLSDGSLEFVGRKDLQIKVRGQRVEIGEVEHYISIFAGVSLSTVISPKTGPYATKLVGVLQLLHPGSENTTERRQLQLLEKHHVKITKFSSERLTSYLKAKLPSYMIPNHWLLVERIPLSVSGKIDRKAVGLWLASLYYPTEDMTIENDHRNREISPDDSIAFKLSSKLKSLMCPKGIQLPSELLGQDWQLENAGIDSIQIISLIIFIKQEFNIKLQVGVLLRSTATIRTIAQHIQGLQARSSLQMVETVASIDVQFQEYKKEMSIHSWSKSPIVQNVLLTGATGFLGSQILKQLCKRNEIEKIIVHVRAKSVSHGMERIRRSATVAGWWSESYIRKIEVWIGNLDRPRLGLLPEQWDRLTGSAPSCNRIHGIIHNGATVHWNNEFSSLRAANVDSTLELVRVIDENPFILKLVYVSGGYHGTLAASRHILKGQTDVLATGYSQTKFISQLIVQEYSQTSVRNQQRVAVVKPGLIIGTLDEGIANVDDFLWRLAASCIEIGSYNEADADCWLFISDVGHVASAIINSCVATSDQVSSSEVDIFDGLLVRDFWSVLRECGFKLDPLPQPAWMSALQADIELRRERHLLWPVLQTLESDHGRMGVPLQNVPHTAQNHDAPNSTRIKSAIQKNVEYLRGIGFLKTADQDSRRPQFEHAIHRPEETFTRSRRVDTYCYRA
ncbi:hypothetical protein BJ875DRAFT_384242 [Amylocarpus encephaloides]|uniref:Carrier domain-containing protein n=1 Tax=Amylocarpus encephaloides TaxID=45428 RepID=A0A9P7YBT2_9HELO|nr:hypothetical protein BJ875DRAFT_384242 [Amylocarpus encephaloides]